MQTNFETEGNIARDLSVSCPRPRVGSRFVFQFHRSRVRAKYSRGRSLSLIDTRHSCLNVEAP